MQEYALRSEDATTKALDQRARLAMHAALNLATGVTRDEKLFDRPSAETVVGRAKWATDPLRFVYEYGPCGSQLVREIRPMGNRLRHHRRDEHTQEHGGGEAR